MIPYLHSTLLLVLVLLLPACGGGGSDDGKVSAAGGNLVLDASHGDGGSAWTLPDCSACHPLQVIHDAVGHIAALVRDKGYGTCTGCHGRNGTADSEPRRCTVCHNDSDLPGSPHQSAPYAHGFSAGTSGALTDTQCLVCHVAADMDGVFEPDRDLTRYPDAAQLLTRYTSVSDFCLRCHNRDHQQPGFEPNASSYDDPLVAVEDAFRFIDRHGLVDGSGTRSYAGLRPGYRYQSLVECTDCHSMHGTGNSGLIIDRSDQGVSRLDPALRDTPYPVTVRNGDYSQLCVLCHRMEIILDAGDRDTGNGLAGVHETGSDCRGCHSHGEAVQAGL